MFGKNSKKKSDSLICPKCGKAVDKKVIAAAEEKTRKKIEESIKEFGTISVNLKWKVDCNHCGHTIVY